jgi:hypothetical protein
LLKVGSWMLNVFRGQSQVPFSTERVPGSGQTPNVQRSTLNIQLRYLLKVGSWMLNVFRGQSQVPFSTGGCLGQVKCPTSNVQR